MLYRLFVRGFLAILLVALSPTSASAQTFMEQVLAKAIAKEFLRHAKYAPNEETCGPLFLQMATLAIAGKETGELRKQGLALKCLDLNSRIDAVPVVIRPDGRIASQIDWLKGESVKLSWSAYPVRYVQLAVFSESTQSDIARSLEGLLPQERIVIDLRGNLGGSLGAAHGALTLFAPHEGAPIFFEEYRTKREVHRAKVRGPYAGRSVALLVDHDTASAAEIFAAALKFWGGRHTAVIGQRTFGKGSVQGCVLCGGTVEAWVTIAHILVGSDEELVPIHGVGVTPNVPLLRGTDALSVALVYYDAVPKAFRK